jgi:hypothetical protein
MPMQGHVFISYARGDRETADAIVESLEAGGVVAWIDHRDVEIGLSYATAISTAIAAASAVAVVLSPLSANSAHVHQEVAAAASRGIPVLAFRSADVEVPDPLLRYLMPPPPLQTDVPAEERIARFASDVATVTAGQSRALARPATPPSETANAILVARIAERLGRSASRHLRATAGVGVAIAMVCLLCDAVAYFEEWVSYADSWAAPIEDVDITDYIAAVTVFHLLAAPLLGNSVRSWVLAVGTARALDARATPEIIGTRLFSVRRLLLPRAALKQVTMPDCTGRAPWSVELWWPALLSSIASFIAMLLLIAISSTVPAILIIALLVLSHLLALTGCICLFLLPGAVDSPRGLSTAATAAADSRQG